MDKVEQSILKNQINKDIKKGVLKIIDKIEFSDGQIFELKTPKIVSANWIESDGVTESNEPVKFIKLRWGKYYEEKPFSNKSYVYQQKGEFFIQDRSGDKRTVGEIITCEFCDESYVKGIVNKITKSGFSLLNWEFVKNEHIWKFIWLAKKDSRKI